MLRRNPSWLSERHWGHNTCLTLNSFEGIIKKIGNESLEITFLGTGAAIPSKYRNVTGIYLSLFARGGMLVDCGEGSFGQLKRRFGEGIWDVIRNLRCAWVSHIHADHHAGLTRYLSTYLLFFFKLHQRIAWSIETLRKSSCSNVPTLHHANA